MNKISPLLEMHITCEENSKVFETIKYGSNTHAMINYLEKGGLKVLKMRIKLA
jgi:hypothetical protein